MAVHGYARVKAFEQNLGIQRAACKAAGCKVIRAEKASGTSRNGRTELQALLDLVQPGDTLVVTRIDRLARSMKALHNIVHELKGRRLALRATEQPVDTGAAAGQPFLDMLGVFAEFAPNLRRERQLEGIEAAKALGIYKGRKPTITPVGCACAMKRSSGLLPSHVALASAMPAFTACSGHISSRRSRPAQASRLLCC